MASTTLNALPAVKVENKLNEEREKLVESDKSGSFSRDDSNRAKKRGPKSNSGDTYFYKSLAVVNVAAGLDGCDEQLLPASFRALEADLNLHPSLLGYITLVQTLMLSLFSPVWGFLSDKYSRKWMLVFGTALWGVATICLAQISDFAQILLFRAVNGMALGSVGPISQSILADAAQNEALGLSFGLVQLSSCIGRLLGGVITTPLALKYIGTMRGWRVCFITVGSLSILLSLIVALFVEEAPRQIKKVPEKDQLVADAQTDNTNEHTAISSAPSHVKIFYKNVKNIWKDCFTKKSIIIIILEGFFGTIPWLALNFNTMFLQYCGMTDVQAAIITGFLLIGAALGGVCGGVFGDIMHDISNDHGRPLLGQFAMFGRVPLVFLTYMIIPQKPASFEFYALSCFFIGLTSIAGVAVNRPILSDVIRPDYRGTIFSLTVSIEGIGSSIIGAPLFGYLTEHVFMYKKNYLLISDMTEESRKHNAAALGKTLFYMTAVPWLLSFLFYSLLHFTYGKEYREMNEIVLTEYKYDNEIDSDEDAETTFEKEIGKVN